MRHSGPESGAIHSLSRSWSNESRGPRLTPDDFETRIRIHNGDRPVEAILVLPVAQHTGYNGDRVIARYPLYAAFAVDRRTLERLETRELTGQPHATLSDAVREATELNHKTENAYLDDYQQGRLITVRSWEKSEKTLESRLDNANSTITAQPSANNSTRF